MSKIQVLDSHIADLIAAGEVVERPASVAKELMENAIDAGARKVTVEISHGGLTFLRVTDDGKGIPADQLPTAFLRHATSKLRTEYDLEAIGTLGFRGEALAAIAAVSRVEVMTRTADAPFGATLSLEGGAAGAVEEAGCPLGTTMVVRDLFFNTPARLKFMKKDAAESAAVFAVVQRVALSHPEVSVKFLRDGKQELLTPGDGQLQSAVYAVLGRELALGFRPVKASGEEMTVTGFVSLPACCRASRNWQFFFVNGRQVKSRLMMAALEEAYQNQKMVGKFPGCVLHLTTKLSAVDVNVHPAKTEVKFGNERQVFSAVYHAVLSALEGDRSHPSLTMSPPAAPAKKQEAVPPVQTRFPFPDGSGLRVQDGTYRRETTAGRSLPSSGTARTIEAVSIQENPPAPRVQNTQDPPAVCRAKVLEGITLGQAAKAPSKKEDAPAAQAPVLEEIPLRKASPLRQPSPVSSPAKGEPENLKTIPQEPELPWRMAGEVLNTYIIVERGDTVFFIDKHAAHERMNFDRMKAEGYTPMSQTLLIPAVCRLPAEEMAALLDNLSTLEDFGFEAEELSGAVVVRQAPDYLDAEDIGDTLSKLAQTLLTGGRADPAAARDELLHTMACKAAIKGGWKTSEKELERVAEAVMSGQVKYCPHGRPVAIELTKKELEKQFKRI